MIRESGAAVEIVEVENPVAEELLGLVHLPEYLHKVRNGTLSDDERYRLGLPWTPSLYDRCRLEVAGTVQATQAALEEGMACNLAGGTHHSFPDRGLGYCVFNDVAVAIRHLQLSHPEMRVMVLDTDAHQGNGTHFIFSDDPNVFTYSIHVGRNYPSKKYPGNADVELDRWIDGITYLKSLRSSLEQVFFRADPDIVFWIAGSDPHEDDQFGQMKLTTAQMGLRDETVLGMCLEQELALVCVYGGGYNAERLHTARLHANTVIRAAEWYAQLQETGSPAEP